ncbi:ZIP family metal transporter [Hyalangium gracile]|uniref:ZIP family metal transporter n=1 Tax=Hyalangium gracile TaxID=394092 RepID=UPI001CC8FD69|nr:ZIP family metal transporter [Hyalangium gracile]
MSWIWPLLAGFLVSSAALVGSSAILLLGQKAEQASTWLLSFAIGTLLGAATLGLLPEALEHAPAERVMPLLLSGMLAFILLERVLRWRHPHEHHAGLHHPEVEQATATMLLWGDAVHNFIDGLVLGASFSVSPAAGLTASLAVFAHEVPQELSDFAILLRTGMSRRRALLLNYLSALSLIPGVLIAFMGASFWRESIGWLLPLVAGGFIYIALADLVPALHHRRGVRAGILQMLLLLAGILVPWGLGRLPHGA